MGDETVIHDSMTALAERRVPIGQIGSPFGIQGNVKVASWTEPAAAIFSYQPWIIVSHSGKEWLQPRVRGRRHGQQLVACIPSITDRDQAYALSGGQIYIPRSALPPLDGDCYYWVDLEGLRVSTVSGQLIGRVASIFSTGANDVLVVQGERERMIPLLIPDVIRSVNRDLDLIEVDWDPSF